eukprot:g3697.t1
MMMLAMVLIRFIVGTWPHSGQGKPPMYGDFEAQRHWLEITSSLPLGNWYSFDVQYWGLDYPPLQAFHAWAFGAFAQRVYPAGVALNTSRGYEEPSFKAYMRSTVVVSDMVVLFPACFYLGKELLGARKFALRFEWMVLQLLSPALLLIDHGHFQYNAVCIGLAIAACVAYARRSDLTTAVLFTLSLHFKQIALFYALPFFFVLIASSWRSNKQVFSAVVAIVRIGVVTVAIFALLWLPFCIFSTPADGCTGGLWRVLRRIFPVERGLFEDKVANFWCATDPLFKLRQFVNAPMAGTISLLAALPSCLALLFKAQRPDVTDLLYALTSTSLAFFIFGFQVHEKNILFPLSTASMLVAREPKAVSLFMFVGCFSMSPLLLREGLAVPYAVLTATFCILSFSMHTSTFGKGTTDSRVEDSPWFAPICWATIVGACVLHITDFTVPPPSGLPDIHTLAVCVYSCGFFLLAWAYTSWKVIVAAQGAKEKALKRD